MAQSNENSTRESYAHFATMIANCCKFHRNELPLQFLQMQCNEEKWSADKITNHKHQTNKSGRIFAIAREYDSSECLIEHVCGCNILRNIFALISSSSVSILTLRILHEPFSLRFISVWFFFFSIASKLECWAKRISNILLLNKINTDWSFTMFVSLFFLSSCLHFKVINSRKSAS